MASPGPAPSPPGGASPGLPGTTGRGWHPAWPGSDMLLEGTCGVRAALSESWGHLGSSGDPGRGAQSQPRGKVLIPDPLLFQNRRPGTCPQPPSSARVLLGAPHGWFPRSLGPVAVVRNLGNQREREAKRGSRPDPGLPQPPVHPGVGTIIPTPTLLLTQPLPGACCRHRFQSTHFSVQQQSAFPPSRLPHLPQHRSQKPLTSGTQDLGSTPAAKARHAPWGSLYGGDRPRPPSRDYGSTWPGGG